MYLKGVKGCQQKILKNNPKTIKTCILLLKAIVIDLKPSLSIFQEMFLLDTKEGLAVCDMEGI